MISSFPEAPSFIQVQQTVARLIHGNIIVGHKLWEFLSVSRPSNPQLACPLIHTCSSKAMGLSHPAIDTRDMALFRPLRKQLKSKFIVDLPTLAGWFLGRVIGQGYENSVRHPPSYDCPLRS